MDSTIFFRTGRSKFYLYDFYHNEFMLVHPLIEVFSELDAKGIEESYWKKILENSNLDENYESVYEYNIMKYYFLKKNNYFGQLPSDKIIPVISSEIIENQLNAIDQIVFEVTDKCNLKCSYCAYGELYSNYDKRETSFMNFETAKTVLDYFIERWENSFLSSKVHHVFISFYGGEPLLGDKFIEEVVNYVINNFPPFIQYTFSITTNAVLLNKNMEFLVDNNFNILVSLDGDIKNNGNRRTHIGKESFSVIYTNLKLFQEKYPDFFKEKVHFNSVLHNLNTVEEIYNFIYSEFGKIPNISELNENGVREVKKKEFDKIHKNIYKDLSYNPNHEYLEEKLFMQLPKVKSFSIFTSYYTDNHVNTYQDFFSKRKQLRRIATGTCIPFSKKIFVTVNNKILPCERIGQEYSLGTVQGNNIAIDCVTIADFYNQFYGKVYSQCNKCYLLKMCGKCMYYFSNMEDPFCDEFMDKKRFSQYLTNHILELEKNPNLYKRICDEVIMY